MKPISQKKYLKALAVVQAYHEQIGLTTVAPSVHKYKALEELKAGDSVESIHVHSASSLTLNKVYPIHRIKPSYNSRFRFSIFDDNGKEKFYFSDNGHFKALK
ncbi:hypothetical protein [Flavobacterium sp.]|uniref:hypothetical protein n=1 Tax=Flavobacterium sp. TaxID=239 RepID=UPI003D6B7C95